MNKWELKTLWLGLVLTIVALVVVPLTWADDPPPDPRCMWDYRLNHELDETTKTVSAWCDCLNDPPCGFVKFYVWIVQKDFEGETVDEWVTDLDEFEWMTRNVHRDCCYLDIYATSTACGCGLGIGGGCGSVAQNPSKHAGPIEIPWYEVD